MARRGADRFTAIHTEGGLLPVDLLERLLARDRNLEGLTEQDYHLVETRLHEAITESWTRLGRVWEAFQTALGRVAETDAATGLTRERWLLPLFRELGYGQLQATRPIEVVGKTYAVSHLWQHLPVHLVGWNVDVERRTPGVAGAARVTPHGLVQELLNRSKEHMWGVVSNGRLLRLLRDNVSLTRQAYVQFDLEAIFGGQLYSDFAVLWLLLHESRVEAERAERCWLERWVQEAHQQGLRVLDRLRKKVQEAIEALGRGFLAHPANEPLREALRSNRLDGPGYYRQLLRLVYRLLFLFAAEDRDLLLDPAAEKTARERYTEHYSTARLREMAGLLRGTAHADRWPALRLVMAKLGADRGCAELGLPALGSFLWSAGATPDLDRSELANRDLLAAIRALAWTEESRIRRPVDYRNLGPEELGSVYEALLELHPEIDAGAARFELTTASGHERKTSGSYYTPRSLIQCLLDSALDPVLDEAARAGEIGILALKVCDPACGSGHFLIAAAHRIARRLAAVRTGDEEPSPEALRAALRDVIGRCIYGVDQNEMAVELCKVSLWMEALQPGRPLSFLDHRIVRGNSLLGTTPALLARGIPDEAFTAIEGDDKAVATALRRRNRQERDGQMGLLMVAEPQSDYAVLSSGFAGLAAAGEESIAAVHLKEEQHRGLLASGRYRRAKLVADAWCAAFVWRKAEGMVEPVTEDVFQTLGSRPERVPAATRAEIDRLAAHYRFLHWHLAFPDVFRLPKPGEEPDNPQAGWIGGFDVVLGNPPWERVKLQEKEWFATRRPDIAEAPNAAARRKRIAALKEEDPGLWHAWLDALREADGESHLVRNSGRYPLCGRGDINTYSIFAETNRLILGSTGRVGCVVPTGIATDDTTKFFFQDLVESKALVSLFDFENAVGLFPGVGHGRFKFSLLTMAGHARPTMTGAEFVFFAYRVEDLRDDRRRFTLSSDDIALLNPNTRTCPVFRSRRDAELTKAIYRRVPVLIREGAAGDNLWGIKFLAMLHMANDSGLFRTRDQLVAEGWRLDGNVFRRGESACLPLYEAKMVHHFNHRFGDYADQPADSESTALPDVPVSRLRDPRYRVQPRYWVAEEEVLMRATRVPEGLIEAYLTGQNDITAKLLVYWLAGYHLNRGRAELGKDLIFRLFGNVFRGTMEAVWDMVIASDKAPAQERGYPLTEDDLRIIRESPDALTAVRRLIESRCPRWFLGWRDICRATDERTLIATAIPRAGVGHKFPLMLTDCDARDMACLFANLTSLVLDYAARQKLGGTSLTYFVLKQLPVLPPSLYQRRPPWAPLADGMSLIDWLASRVMELAYTSDDISTFARDCGYDRVPFQWDEERRFLIRCELDAAFFHLYGLGPADVDYVMEQFPIVEREDVQRHGDYRTGRVILEIYESMRRAIEEGEPYRTVLDPPPADPRTARGA